MNSLSALIERKVRGHMRRLAWISAAYLTVQGALVARLTWWEFSWDIMEPITYMITFATVAIGAYYFAFTLNDYSYESLSHKLQRRKREKLQRRRGFDVAKFEVLKQKAASLKEELLALGVPATEVEKTTTEAPAAPAVPTKK
jgi:calcium uniporter protein, mitochondrial